MRDLAKIPATVVTGFLGAGKTTLIRHLLQNAGGRRIAVIVNEFGDLGFDGGLISDCEDPSCAPMKVTELTNGCICCTVADDFIPALEAILALKPGPEHILIETSGLALPKPLVKAFDWPSIRSRVTVDGVVVVADGPALAAGIFAEEAPEPQTVGALPEHDFPLAEVFEDQVAMADIVILNKTDLMQAADIAEAERAINSEISRSVRILHASHGCVPPSILIGMNAAVEDDLPNRPAHHDRESEHDHDDFDSFVIELGSQANAGDIAARLESIAQSYGVLRMKGHVEITGKPMRLAIQGVGRRVNHNFDRAWRPDESRDGRLVIIGLKGLDRAAIAASLSAS